MKTEYEEQKELIKYLDDLKFNSKNQIKFSAIPLSTHTDSYQEKTRNTLSGVRAGLPDLFLIINKKCLFIEMKREKGGVLSDFQKKWIEAINESENNIKAYVCKGFEEAREVIEKYLIKE